MNKLKELLENLPITLKLNKENNSLDAICNECGNAISYEIRQRNIKEPPYYCRSCAQKHKHFSKESLKNISEGAKKRSGNGKCTKCGKFVEKRNASGMCSDCFGYIKDIAANQKLSGNCTVCNKFNNKRDQNGRGKDNCSCSKNFYQNHNSSELMVNVIINRNKDQNLSITCKKHGFQKFSFAGKCILCINESKDYESQSKLRTETILEAIESGDLERWPGGVIPNFIVKDDIEYYLDKATGKYVEWKIFKDEFKLSNISNEIIFKIKNLYGGEYYPTFIDKESHINCGHAGFDRYILEKNVNYFVYIKFYKNINNKIIPLVIGQSASYNINSNGSDLSFSNKIEHGPSRKFLMDERLEYYYKEIFIIKTESREDSLNIEKSIASIYNLFES